VAKPAGRSFLASIADIEVEPIPVSEAERSRLRKVRADWLARWLAEDSQFIEHAGRSIEAVGNAIRAAAPKIIGKSGRPDRVTPALREQVIASYRVLSESSLVPKKYLRHRLIASILGMTESTVRAIITPPKRKGR
jgi:hypothetical protein